MTTSTLSNSLTLCPIKVNDIIIVERQAQHEPDRLEAGRLGRLKMSIAESTEEDLLKKPTTKLVEEVGLLLGMLFLFIVIGIF